MRALQDGAGKGTLRVGSARVDVTNLGKTFFPDAGYTKGDLMRYYAGMSPVILPHMSGRPLMLERYPNGIEGKRFFQQNAPEDVPAGVRVETVEDAEGNAARRLVGGSMGTLLYIVQLGSIALNAWTSRVGRAEQADYCVLDLDPGPEAEFQRVVEAARAVKEELDERGLHGAVKTRAHAGCTSFCRCPRRRASMRRRRWRSGWRVRWRTSIRKSRRWSARRSRVRPAPLAWDELTDDLDLEAFTIETAPARVRERGDLWGETLASPNPRSALEVA